MTDELAMKLHEAIQNRETPEVFARADHYLAWSFIGEHVNVRCRWCGWTEEGLEDEINVMADYHARYCVRMPESDLLRICKAHKQIIDLYDGALFTQECHPEYELTKGYVLALRDTLGLLTEYYGVS